MQRRADQPLRVAIVNDYEIVVAGITELLAPFDGRIVVVEHDGRAVPVSDVDVILYDTFGKVPEDSVDISELVRGGDAKVVVFSWNTQHAVVARALAAGAAGYVAKSWEAGEMVAAIERAHAGETVIPAGGEGGRAHGDWPGRDEGLSAREAEVVALVTQGLTNQEIADRCFLSINSVKTYLRTAYRKMGVNRRSQAVLWGLAHGFEPDHFRELQH